MQNATENARKMDFGRYAKGTSRMPHSSYTLDLVTAKFTAQNGAQQNLGQQ